MPPVTRRGRYYREVILCNAESAKLISQIAESFAHIAEPGKTGSRARH